MKPNQNMNPALDRARQGGPGRMFNGPVVKPKDAKGTLKRIWSYMSKQRLGLILAVLFVILTTLLSLLSPYLIGVIIDDYIIPLDLTNTLKWLLILGSIYFATSLFTWVQNYIMVRVSLKTIYQLRQDLFDKFQTLSIRFFDNRSSGDLMSRVTNDIESLNKALGQSIAQIITSILMIVGVTIAMLQLNVPLALISLIIIPVMLWATKKIIKYSSSNFIKRQRDLGQMNGFIEESISGHEIISLFSQEDKKYEEFIEYNENLRHSAIAADTISGFLGPINNFINNLGLAIIIAVGAIFVLGESITVGVLASFVTYARQFYRPINQLSSLFNMFQSAIAGGERVFEIMDEIPDFEDEKGAIEVEKLKGDIQFKNVSFSYDKERPTLKNINFDIKQGQKIALVGPTGSGKTTIANLLMRFYDIDEGEITIDGRNIKDYKIGPLRKKIGIVLQDTFLFNGTLLENIRYGRLNATDEEVIIASKLARAHQFIKHLPNQYETMVQSGGANLSQGQRQLIAIARAMLANSDILILDEATSNIDTLTEIEIQKGLETLSKNRTTFVIAHRLKTIENADCIFVIQNGEIIEYGNHDELMNKKGFYYSMHH